MDKLLFACQWEKQREKSWSGTNMGLLSSLQKHFDVVDYDTHYLLGSGKLGEMLTLCGKVLQRYGGMDIQALRRKRVSYSVRLQNEDYPIFTFEESPLVKGRRHYIYQDLSVDFLYRVSRNDPALFAYCGLKDISEKVLSARKTSQKAFYDEASGIFTMGKWLARDLIEHAGVSADKVHPVGGGSNIDYSKIDDSKKNGNRILFVGRDFERKNGPLVVEAFRLVRQQNKKCELYIAGPANLRLHEEGVTVLGDLKYDQLVDYFNLCDIFCMPSHFEAYGLVFAEALIFGLPCIGRDAFEMPYFIQDGETGLLLKEQSPEELASLMLSLLGNNEIRKNVLERREWYINEYSWNAVGNRIANEIHADKA